MRYGDRVTRADVEEVYPEVGLFTAETFCHIGVRARRA